MLQFNFIIKHCLGVTNLADSLLRCLDYIEALQELLQKYNKAFVSSLQKLLA